MLFVSIIKIGFNLAVKFHLQPYLSDWAGHEIFPQCQALHSCFRWFVNIKRKEMETESK